MKQLCFMFCLFFMVINAHAQLQNSKWKATLQLNEPVDVVFIFSSDTLTVVSAENNESLETMVYTISDTTLTMRKLEGQSNCDTDVTATYSIKISGDEMQLSLIKDECYDRSGVINHLKLHKAE